MVVKLLNVFEGVGRLLKVVACCFIIDVAYMIAHGSTDAMQHTCSAAHIQCNTHEVNHIAVQCNTLPHRMDFMQCNGTHEMHCSAAQCNATHMQCNTHTHIATHMQCNTVHCSAAHCPAGWTSMKAPVQVCVVMWPTRLLSTMIVMVVMAHA